VNARRLIADEAKERLFVLVQLSVAAETIGKPRRFILGDDLGPRHLVDFSLAALGPIVAGVGGNAGTQTLAVTVRAFATNQLTTSNQWRAVGREIRVALLNGLTIALLIGIGVSLVLQSPALGLVIGAAMMTNIVIAGLAGVLVPLTLERAGADPAVASSVFVTMTTDSMGFLVFLGLAVASGLAG